MSENSSRPWQGTMLAIVDILITIFSFLFAIMFLFMGNIISSLAIGNAGREITPDLEELEMSLETIGRLGIGGTIFCLLLGVLGIFMARGAFKGQKWSPIVLLIFAGLGILSWLANNPQFGGGQAVTLLINGLIIYCAIVCVRSPYFRAS